MASGWVVLCEGCDTVQISHEEDGGSTLTRSSSESHSQLRVHAPDYVLPERDCRVTVLVELIKSEASFIVGVGPRSVLLEELEEDDETHLGHRSNCAGLWLYGSVLGDLWLHGKVVSRDAHPSIVSGTELVLAWAAESRRLRFDVDGVEVGGVTLPPLEEDFVVSASIYGAVSLALRPLDLLVDVLATLHVEALEGDKAMVHCLSVGGEVVGELEVMRASASVKSVRDEVAALLGKPPGRVSLLTTEGALLLDSGTLDPLF